MGFEDEFFDYCLAFSDIRLSEDSWKLSHEAASLCAVLILDMPDPNVQSPTDFEIEKFLREYENPRRLPEKWLKNYLGRPRPQLAIDVIRVYDEKTALQRQLSRAKVTIWIMSLIVSPLIGELVKLLFARLVK